MIRACRGLSLEGVEGVRVAFRLSDVGVEFRLVARFDARVPGLELGGLEGVRVVSLISGRTVGIGRRADNRSLWEGISGWNDYRLLGYVQQRSTYPHSCASRF